MHRFAQVYPPSLHFVCDYYAIIFWLLNCFSSQLLYQFYQSILFCAMYVVQAEIEIWEHFYSDIAS